MEQDLLLQQTRQLLSQGSHDQARSLAVSRQTREVRDPALHLAWAEVLEEMGLIEEVVLELNLARRDDPEHLETYRRLAEIYLDQGKPRTSGGTCSSAAPGSPWPTRSWAGPWRRPRNFPRPDRSINLAWTWPSSR